MMPSLSVMAVAEQLGLRPVTIRQWIAARRIASAQLGRRRLVPRCEVHRLISENLVPALTTRRPLRHLAQQDERER
jgi:excisionase family DNA binding protein